MPASKTDQIEMRYSGLPMLSVDSYERLSTEAKTRYIEELRLAYIDFETSVMEGIPLANHSQSPPSLEIAYLLLPIANATTNDSVWDKKCLIGGQEQNIQKNTNGKAVCPTTKNNCNDLKDFPKDITNPKETFKCGPIFNNVCISRNPILDISPRCKKASKGPVDQFQFGQIAKNQMATFRRTCQTTIYKAAATKAITKNLQACIDWLDRYRDAYNNYQSSGHSMYRFGRAVATIEEGNWLKGFADAVRTVKSFLYKSLLPDWVSSKGKAATEERAQ